MFVKLLLIFSLLVLCCGDEVENSVEMDPILYYLLNAEFEEHMPPEIVETKDIDVDGGLWKCGMCDDLSKLILIHSETNEDDEADTNISSVQKVEISHSALKCVIVRSSSSNIVRSVKGDCEGPTVTLTLAPTTRYILDVFGDSDYGESD